MIECNLKRTETIMKAKIIRDYPKRAVNKNMIDVEDSLFERGLSKSKISCGAVGMFVQLKVYDNHIVNIYKLSADTRKETDLALKELQKVGLIKSMDVIENNINIKVIYLQNPDEIL
jgi:hypothetical protein